MLLQILILAARVLPAYCTVISSIRMAGYASRETHLARVELLTEGRSEEVVSQALALLACMYMHAEKRWMLSKLPRFPSWMTAV